MTPENEHYPRTAATSEGFEENGDIACVPWKLHSMIMVYLVVGLDTMKSNGEKLE